MDASERLYNEVLQIWPWFQRLQKWHDGSDPYPGTSWRQELEAIYTRFHEVKPDTLTDSPEAVMRSVGEDEAAGRQAAMRLRQWTIDWLSWPPRPEVDRAIKECESKDHQEAQLLDETLVKLGRPVVAASELTDRLEIASARLGRLLKSRGHVRQRIASSGDCQYVWIVADHARLSKLSRKELRAYWERGCTDDEEKSVSFI